MHKQRRTLLMRDIAGWIVIGSSLILTGSVLLLALLIELVAQSGMSGWYGALALVCCIGTVGSIILMVSACVDLESDWLFLKKDWRDLNKFRIIGKPGEYRVQARFWGKWFFIKPRYPHYEDEEGVVYDTEYEAQEFVAKEKEKLHQYREEIARRKQEGERLKRERNQVVGKFRTRV